MYRFLGVIKYLALTIAFVSFGAVLAQATTLDPRSWFTNQEAVLAAAALITPWLTKVATALGKDWFSTDGNATVWLSAAVAALIAGVGGYLGLGYLAGETGLMAGVQAAGLTLFAFLMSNGMAKGERQVAKSAAASVQTAATQAATTAVAQVLNKKQAE